MFFNKNQFPIKGKFAIVAGGSQGAGFEFAKILAKRGGNVIIVARSEDKLKKAIENIKRDVSIEDNSQVLDYISADLTTYENCNFVLSKFTEITNVELPDIYICCVGTSIPKLFVDLTPYELESGIKTNYMSALYFTHASMKRIAESLCDKSLKRHIVLFSSVLAHFSFIGYSQYSPLKAALKNLTDTIQQEAALYNVNVSCVYPGNFASEGFIEEQKTKPEITKLIEGPSEPIGSDECAELILRQLDQGSEVITTDFIGYILSCLSLRTRFSFDLLSYFLLSTILHFVSPIAYLVINNQISNYFKKQKAEKKD